MTTINSMPLKSGEAKINLQKGSLSTEGLAIKVSGANNGVVLYYDCGNATPITFKGGDTVFGGDFTVTVPGGEGYCALDIGAAIQKSGTYKDHILLTAATNDCTVGLIELI